MKRYRDQPSVEPNDEGKIIDDTKDAVDEFGHSYGSEVILISRKQLEELQNGKLLATFDGEYVHFIAVELKEAP